MRSRSLYRFILQLNPSSFRNKYEDQMLWIYDESVENRGAVSLLFDAVVSLARQWVVRSGRRRHGRQPMAVGAVALERLRLNAQALHRRAWQLNLLWMVGAFIVLLLSRLHVIWGPFIGFIFANAIGVYWQSRQGRRAWERPEEYVTLSLSSTLDESRELYRRRIEGKRDGLVKWCRFEPSKIPWNSRSYLGGKGLLVVLFVAGLQLLFRPLRPGTSYDWLALFEFLFGLVVLTVFWHFVKKVNARAAQAIQQELDALDEPSKPQSV